MRRKSLFLLLIVAVSGIISCRKGPEDPLFSFVTRKNRISKEWKAYSYLVNGQENLTNSETIDIAQGDCGTQTIQRMDSIVWVMNFRKNGEFFEKRCEVIKENSTVTNPDGAGCSALVFNKDLNECVNNNGFWNFAGGVGNTANKEQLFLYVQETGVGVLWDIVRLANDELKLKRRYIKPGESVFTTEEIWFEPVE